MISSLCRSSSKHVTGRQSGELPSPWRGLAIVERELNAWLTKLKRACPVIGIFQGFVELEIFAKFSMTFICFFRDTSYIGLADEPMIDGQPDPQPLFINERG